ncbi:hypothetical protein BU24DRAFT_458220 [Aaosphaeria arxii CBS 175.79]|uniref:F-box domain-containing protein n=1 Tax=Aaosphaeria arxii CBS 175.79 TaxID=1450172 RepID=A0A6A5YAV5_9PLEO|nr:uncharacterized protein BU24DRAFT_458220 [Aaosphaeria arxii CBS 175.79]KAF2022363.1 hypothetical protein BU24DRAFT_458220 [Aaosphaeria arxii CBS 175.79]
MSSHIQYRPSQGFFALPRELRDMIYMYTFVSSPRSFTATCKTSLLANLPPLLKTNLAIHSEATPIWLAHATTTVSSPASLVFTITYLKSWPACHRLFECITSISITSFRQAHLNSYYTFLSRFPNLQSLHLFIPARAPTSSSSHQLSSATVIHDYELANVVAIPSLKRLCIEFPDEDFSVLQTLLYRAMRSWFWEQFGTRGKDVEIEFGGLASWMMDDDSEEGGCLMFD